MNEIMTDKAQAVLKGKSDAVERIYKETNTAYRQSKDYSNQLDGRKAEISAEAEALGINEVSKALEAQKDFKAQLMEEGYDQQRAEVISLDKTIAHLSQVEFDAISTNGPTKQFSVDLLDLAATMATNTPRTWDQLTLQEKQSILWELGVQAKAYGIFNLVGCIRIDSDVPKPVCGKFIAGMERTDKAWQAALYDNGEHKASLEARYTGNMGELHRMQGGGSTMQWDEDTLGKSANVFRDEEEECRVKDD